MRKTAALVDTGILYALADKGDAWHGRAATSVAGFRGRLIVPASVLPEACYLLNSCLGPFAETAFLVALNNREMSVEQVTPPDMVRIVEILKRYAGANIGFVDASLVAVAERLGIDTIFTTDRRHFSLVKPARGPAFTLLP
jgi:predicted nucleic acid-binding protein